MIKTVLKVNGMMCGMCEVHMNDLVRKNFNVKKVTSSVKGGETVVISEENLDIPFLKKEIKEIGYELVDVHTEPYEKKGFFSFWKEIIVRNKNKRIEYLGIKGRNTCPCEV